MDPALRVHRRKRSGRSQGRLYTGDNNDFYRALDVGTGAGGGSPAFGEGLFLGVGAIMGNKEINNTKENEKGGDEEKLCVETKQTRVSRLK